MADASKLLLIAGLVCGVFGVVWHQGPLAVSGVVLLVAGLLLRALAPRAQPRQFERPRFGPTTVASTMPGDPGKPFDIKPHD